MLEYRNAYKVVYAARERLISCCQNSDLPLVYRTTYVPGMWIESPVRGSKLFVFDTAQDAKSWYRETFPFWSGFQIWSCECIGLAPCELVPRVNTANDYWLGLQESFQPNRIWGAHVTAAVRLLEKVWYS